MLDAVTNLVREIYLNRWQILITFRSDFALVSKLTGLGTAWGYILPVVPITVYMALMAGRVLPDFKGVNSLVYVAIGVTLWLLYSGLILRPIQVLENKFREVSRTQIPMIVAVISSFAELLFETFVRLALVVVLFAIYQGWPAPQVFAIPGVLILALLVFFPIGLILGLANLAYRDVGKIARLVLQYGIFLSGAIFPVHALPMLGNISKYNPFYVLIETVRSLAVEGTLPLWSPLVIWGMIGVALSLVAIRAFYVLELQLRGLA